MGLLELFNSYDKKKRKSHFKNLFNVARVDGGVDRSELDLIVGLAEKFQMSTEEVTKIIRNPEAVAWVMPKTTGERLEHLYDLVVVMIVNGQIDERELFLCKSLGVKLGFGEDTIDSLVRDLIERAMKGDASDKVLKDLTGRYS